MKKNEKLSLSNLKVESFKTSSQAIKGGYTLITRQVECDSRDEITGLCCIVLDTEHPNC